MDILLIILGSGCAHVSSGYWRAITDVVFGEVFGAGNEGWWGFASHEKRTGVKRVADGNVTEAIEDRVVVENMVSCDKCREDGGSVDCNHICLGFVQIEGGRVSEVIEGKVYLFQLLSGSVCPDCTDEYAAYPL